MDHIGIDVHKRESQICIETEDGEVIEKRIRTERERFEAVFAGRPRAKILLESMTEAEWVARCLEDLGHEVIVADPSYGAMYATRSRRVKTDRRDAVTLADACRLQAYRHAHRTSDRQRRGAGPSRGSWRWRGSWRGSSTRCGATGAPTRSVRAAPSGRPPRRRGRREANHSHPGSNTGER